MPADRLAVGERLRAPLDERGIVENLEGRAHGLEPALDVRLLVLRTEIAAAHRVTAAVQLARCSLYRWLASERGAERAAGVARRGLQPDLVEDFLAQQLAVRHAVERDAAREAQVAFAGFARHAARELDDHFFGDDLNARGQIHFALRQGRLGLARRAAEQLVELRIGHAQSGAVVEVVHVETERAVVLHVDEMVADLLHEPRLAIGREAHHLVLAGVDLEAGVVRERGIQQAQRVREVDLANDLEICAVADRERSRRPLADAIHGQHGGALERRRIERARRMTQVVLGEEQPCIPVDAVAERRLQCLRKDVLLEQLVLHPHGQRLAKGRESARRERQIRLEQALELQERLVVEGDMVEIAGRQAGFLEAVAHGVLGKTIVVLLARETLFLRGRDDLAVHHEGGGRVVVVRGDAENLQGDLRTTCR